MRTPTSRKIGDIVDRLAVARYLNEAVHMACSHEGLTIKAQGALQALVAEVEIRMEAIEQDLQIIMEDLA
ncbi:hypothetical protein [Rhizobium sp. PP-CC-3G-465]|uniref:hypothetical protein n=1 Tax=Rhizobium sp. PP-CC-3G-465 TaxID=2135648 RepID=UPI001042885C|nr:hypothetical protein C8J33_101871 [Rhizobium sp. PP-CC-3G-465]